MAASNSNFTLRDSYLKTVPDYAQQQQQSRSRPDRPKRDPQPIIYSICIPRVFKNISEKRIRAIFYSLKLGFVERVDMVSKTSAKGDEFSRVFVHFSNWNENNSNAVQIQQKLDSGEKVKIVYDTPWFWLITKSQAPRPEQRRRHRPAPFIDFGHTGPQTDPEAEPHSPPSPHPQPKSPDYAPRSPDYAPPSPDYLPHTPTSPAPHVAHLVLDQEEADAEEEFRRKKELNALGI
jgi:hypothetical protein